MTTANQWALLIFVAVLAVLLGYFCVWSVRQDEDHPEDGI